MIGVCNLPAVAFALHTSHVIPHTSHVTRHTPHATRHTPHIALTSSWRAPSLSEPPRGPPLLSHMRLQNFGSSVGPSGCVGCPAKCRQNLLKIGSELCFNPLPSRSAWHLLLRTAFAAAASRNLFKDAGHPPHRTTSAAPPAFRCCVGCYRALCLVCQSRERCSCELCA